MKKEYFQPTCFVVTFNSEDVISTSIPTLFDKNPFDPADFEDGDL